MPWKADSDEFMIRILKVHNKQITKKGNAGIILNNDDAMLNTFSFGYEK